MTQNGHYPSGPPAIRTHRCARTKEGGSDCHSSMRKRNCCADGPATLFKTEKSTRSAGPQKRTKAPRCRLTRGARGCEPAPRTLLPLSRGIELSLARPCPAACVAMYAQIMVKMRHRGLASNPCISRRPAEKSVWYPTQHEDASPHSRFQIDTHFWSALN